MINLLLKIIIALVLVVQYDAQVNLNRTNIAGLCNCIPIDVTTIWLNFKNIRSIDSATFNGLTTLNTIYLYNNHELKQTIRWYIGT